MYCVTNAAIQGLSPYSLQTRDPQEQSAVRTYLEGWIVLFILVYQPFSRENPKLCLRFTHPNL